MNTSGYLDYAAATPLDPLVAKAVADYTGGNFANPSSMHTPGRQARKALEESRSAIAGMLGAKAQEIIFTSGSTEAAQIVINGALKAFPAGEIAVAAIEHKAVLQTAAITSSKEPKIIPCAPNGITAPEAVAGAITDNTVLVCVQYANNEIGTLQPVAKIAAEIRRIRERRAGRGIGLPLYFYCDGAQAGLLSLQMSRLGVDLFSMGGSKIYGPSGSGFLYIRTGTNLAPVFAGGGQERGLRGGTENVAAAVGLAKALTLVQSSRDKEARRLKELRNGLWQTIQATISGVTLHGALDHRLPHNLHLSFAGCEGEALVMHLNIAGFAVATGSACTASHEDPSHVLLAIGCTTEMAQSSLRISLGRFTAEEEIEVFVAELGKAVNNVRKLAK